jgi:hypothetical protein
MPYSGSRSVNNILFFNDKIKISPMAGLPDIGGEGFRASERRAVAAVFPI